MQTICYWFTKFDKRSPKKNVLKTFHTILALRCTFWKRVAVCNDSLYVLSNVQTMVLGCSVHMLEITDQLIFVAFRGEKWAGWLVR